MGDGFLSVYKRHTQFSMDHYTQPVSDKITIQPRGDLVSYVYFTRSDSSGLQLQWNWEDILEFEWWIGDRLIDSQDVSFIRYVYPKIMSRTFSKTNFDTAASTFLPLSFSFCVDTPFPLISLQYHTMDIRIKKGPSFDPSYVYQCHINYIHLDEPERLYFALNKQSIYIHRTFKVDPRNDIQLNCPIKFIATPAVKIPQNFTYSVRVNNQNVRTNEPYTGSEVMFNTEYGEQGTIKSDKFPPGKLTGETTLISTAYGRGFYNANASTFAYQNYPWKTADNNNQSYWQSRVYTSRDVDYIATSSSNFDTAWKAFAGPSNTWVSAESFGKRVKYSIDKSAWTQGPVYGNNASFDFVANTTSNTTALINMFDGNAFTVWKSDPQCYATGIEGTFTINANSASQSTTVIGPFTGASYWESNATFGTFTTPGVYTSEKYNAFTVNSYYEGSNLFGKFTNTYPITLSSNTGNVVLAFNNLPAPWISDDTVGTYGFSSYAGVFTATASNNASNAYLAFDGNGGTSWVSNSMYFKNFTGSYNVSSSSDTTNAYLAVDNSNITSWSSNTNFGSYIQAGQYSISATSNANGYVYLTLASPSNTWTSAKLYGNVLPSNSYNASASSNTLNAWTAFSSSWTSANNIYGQVRFKAGQYIETFSSGVSTKVFGKVGNWTSANNYGFSIPAGTYAYSNSSGNALGAFTNSNAWYAQPSVTTSNIDEFITFSEIGSHTITASSNSANASLAFSPGVFNFNVDSYKTISSQLRVTSTSSNLTASNVYFERFSNIFVNINPSLYARIPKGTYRIANNFVSTNLHFPFTGGNLTIPCGTLNTDGSFFTGVKTLSFVYPSEPISSYTNTLTNNDSNVVATLNGLTISVTGVTKANLPSGDLFSFINIQDDFSISTPDYFSKFDFGTYRVNPFDAYKLFDNDTTTNYISTSNTITVTLPDSTSRTCDLGPKSVQNLAITQTNSSGINSNLYGMIVPCTIAVGGSYISDNNDIMNVENPPYGIGINLDFRNAQQPSIQFNFSTTNVYINRMFLLTLQEADLPSTFYIDIGTGTNLLITQTYEKTISLNNTTYIYRIYSFSPINIGTLTINFNSVSPIYYAIFTVNLTFGYNDQKIYPGTFDGTPTKNYNDTKLISKNIPQDGVMNFPFTFNNQYAYGYTGPNLLTYPNLNNVISNKSVRVYRSLPDNDYYYGVIANPNEPTSSWASAVEIGSYLKLSDQNYFLVASKYYSFLYGNIYNQFNDMIRQEYTTDSGVILNATQTGIQVRAVFGKQVWTVPKTGLYSFEVAGAGNSSSMGAIIFSRYYLNKGDVIEIIVGQEPNNSYGYGGSFVVKINNTGNELLFVAGGGANPIAGVVLHATLSRKQVGQNETANQDGAGYSLDGTASSAFNFPAQSYSNGGYGSSNRSNPFIGSGGFGGGGVFGGGGYIGGFYTQASTPNASGGSSYDINNNPALGRVTNVGPGYVKIDYIQPQPYLGTTIGEGAIVNFNVSEPLNNLYCNCVSGKYNLFGRNNILLQSNLFSNVLYNFSTPFNYDRYVISFTELYNSSNVGPIKLQFSNNLVNGKLDQNQLIYTTLPYVNLSSYTPTFDFPFKSFTTSTNVITVSSSIGYGFTGNVPLKNPSYYIQLDSATLRDFPFSKIGFTNPSLEFYYKVVTTTTNGSYSSFDYVSETSYTSSTNIPINTKGLRIQITKVVGGTSLTCDLQLFSDDNTVINTGGTVYTYPLTFRFPNLSIRDSIDNRSLVPTFPATSTSNTFNITSANIDNNLRDGGYYIGSASDNGEFFVVDNTDAVTARSDNMTLTFISAGKFAITSTARSKLSGNVQLFDTNNRLITPLFTSGGAYTGSVSTNGILGEWVQYTFPRPTRVFSNALSYRSSASTDPVGLRFLRFDGTNFVNFNSGDTSNTFRIVVTNTTIGASSNTCTLSNVSFQKALSNTTNVITSGMDAYIYDLNGQLLSRMKNYTFGDSTLRGILPSGLKPYQIQFYGNVYVPFTLQAGQSVIYSDSNLVSAWIGSNADTPTSSNVLTPWPLRTNAYIINTTISGGQYTRIRANLINVSGQFNLYFASNIGTTLTNVSNVNAPYYPGGDYNGFGSNCWAQITLPQNVKIGGYYLNSVNANNWIVYGATNANGPYTRLDGNNLPNKTVFLNPSQSYNVYRVEVTNTLFGNIYSNISSMLFFDSNNRAIFTGPGTFSAPVPIGNYPIGEYSSTFNTYASIFNPYSTTPVTFTSDTVFTLPTPVQVTRIFMSNASSSIVLNGATITGGSSTPVSMSSFTVKPTTLTRLLFINSNGLVIPTTTQFNSETGGNYTGAQVTGTDRGDWIDLSIPSSNLFRYEIVSDKMPMGWSLYGNTGTTWQLLDRITNNFSLSYSSYIYANAYSNIRLVVSNTFTNTANIISLNVYTQNFTNVFTEQTITNDIPESTYIPVTYTASQSTLFDNQSRTWISNLGSNNSILTLTFNKPTRLTRMDVYDTVRTGLQFTEFTSKFDFISMADLKTRPITRSGYTDVFNISTSNAFYLQGYLNVFTSGTTFTFGSTLTRTNDNCSVWINVDPISAASNTFNTRFLPGQITLNRGYYKFSLFSNADLKNFNMRTNNNDMLNNPSEYIGWFTPTNKPFTFTDQVSLDFIANPVTGTPNTHTFTKTQAAYNSFLISNTSYFSSANIIIKTDTANLRSILSNITLYSDNGPVNIPGSQGGFTKTREWIQLRIPNGFTVNSYSINVASLSNVILRAGTSEASLSVINTQMNPGSSHIMIPNSTSNIYRFEVSETSTTNLTIGNVKLYDINGQEVNPIMTSNNFVSSLLDLGQCIRGNYTVTSSVDELFYSLNSLQNGNAYIQGSSFGTINGNTLTTSCTLLTKPLYGQWLQMELPRPQLVNTFALEITNPATFPNTITFCASTDGFNWVSANTTLTTNVFSPLDRFHRFPTTLSTPYKFYRVVISNVIPNQAGTCNFGKLLLLDRTGRRLNSFYDAQLQTFGGSNNTNEVITFNLPTGVQKRLKYIRITSGTNQHPSNLSINGEITFPRFSGGKYIYTAPNPTARTTHLINVNSVNFNTFGSNVSIDSMELIDERGGSIVPILTNNTNTYNSVTIPTPYYIGTFKCSNVFAFDDDINTSWVAPQNSNVFFEFPEIVTITRYTIVDPYLTSWKISNSTTSFTVNEQLTFTNTYSISITTSNVAFQVLGGLNIVGGLVFYDSRGRLNPTMSLQTQIIESSNIRGGLHISSNESILINLSSPATINSYSITSSPFPASWNVYAGSTLIHRFSNFFGNVTTESFQVSTSVSASNVRLEITETQPSTSSNIQLTYFQVYDSNGQFILPQFTSNTLYSNEEYSREMIGYYEYAASSYTDASNAFNSDPTSYYESLSNTATGTSNNYVLYYSNIAIANCTDFRNITTATKGRNFPAAQCVWRNLAGVTITPPRTDQPVKDWIQIKLPAFATVTAYRVVSTDIRTWTLQGSTNGRDFTNIEQVQSTTDTRVLSNPVIFKYYRLQVEELTRSGTFKVYSFDLYNTFGKINSYT